MYRKLFTILAIAASWAAAMPAHAQGDARIGALFPKSGQVPGWQIQTPPKYFHEAEVFKYMDGAGEIPRSYGLKELGSTIYKKGDVTLEAVIFDLGSPTGAFGFYSIRSFLDRSPAASDCAVPTAGGARIDSHIGILTAWKGNFVFILQPQDGKPDDASLLQFAGLIATAYKTTGTPPTLLHALPHKDSVSGTIRYLRGKAAFDSGLDFSATDVFGAGKGAQAVAEELNLPGAVGSLAIVQYPDGKTAAAAYMAYRHELDAQKTTFVDTGSPDFFIAYTPKEKGTGAFVDGNRLYLVLYAKGPKATEKDLSAVIDGLALVHGPTKQNVNQHVPRSHAGHHA